VTTRVLQREGVFLVSFFFFLVAFGRIGFCAKALTPDIPSARFVLEQTNTNVFLFVSGSSSSSVGLLLVRLDVMATAVLAEAAVAVLEVVAHLIELFLRLLSHISHVLAAAVVAQTTPTGRVVVALLLDLHRFSGLASAPSSSVLISIVLGFSVARASTAQIASVVLAVTEVALLAVLT